MFLEGIFHLYFVTLMINEYHSHQDGQAHNSTKKTDITQISMGWRRRGCGRVCGCDNNDFLLANEKTYRT
jgi:hypothetical protein